MATVVANPAFSSESACEGLRKAMKGFGTDEKAIIQILTSCDSVQRSTLDKTFKTLYGKSLMEDLKSELGGNLEDVVIALMTPPAEYDAKNLHKSMDGLGTDEGMLIEIMTTRSNAEMEAIKIAYQKKYGKELEDDIMGDTSGTTRRLLVSLAQANRNETDTVDDAKTDRDVEDLVKAGKGSWGTDESAFNRILMTSNCAQLRATSAKYREVTQEDLIRTIEKEMSGDAEKAFKSLLEAMRNPALYFATKLYKSMDGIGTNDGDLQRAVITRVEKDMVQIKEEFFNKYNKSLGKMISGDCSGDYKKVLLALIGESK